MKWTAITAVGAAFLAASCGKSEGALLAGEGAEAGDSRTFQFTYTARIPAPPAGTGELQIWVPLPMEDPGVQEVSELETRVNGDSAAGTRTREPVYGNEMLHVVVEQPGDVTEVGWTARVIRHADVGQGSLPTAPQYLQSNRLIPLGDSARLLVTKLGVGEPSSPTRSRARTVFDDVLQSMEYDKQEPGYGNGDFERALTVCKGNCTDFHARFIGTCRSAGIPCRFTMGIPMKPDPEGSYNSYHCWAHWHDGERWQPVDISEADKIVASDPDAAERFFGHLDANRIALSFGRDVVLEPPQQGEPLNYFVFPYAEADGQRLELDKSMWIFEYENR